MAIVSRSSVINGIAQDLGINQAVDNVPIRLKEDIQASFDVNPKYTTIVKQSSSAVTGTITLYTTPTDKDFYLTYFEIGVIKDVTSDISAPALSVKIGNLTTNLTVVRLVPLVANSTNYCVSLAYPIKIDRNSAITFTGTSTAGTCTRGACIAGFILE